MEEISDHQLIKLGNFFVDMTKLSKEDGFFSFCVSVKNSLDVNLLNWIIPKKRNFLRRPVPE